MNMTRQKRPPKKRSIEIEIDVEGKKKRIVATKCTIKSPISSKLGIGKRREFMACQSIEIIVPGDEKSEEEEKSEEMIERRQAPGRNVEREESDEEPDLEEMNLGPRGRAKARPPSPYDRKKPMDQKRMPED